ncbi:hypothetical protein MRX96_032059 [Rhipicephalus microplus]
MDAEDFETMDNAAPSGSTPGPSGVAEASNNTYLWPSIPHTPWFWVFKAHGKTVVVKEASATPPAQFHQREHNYETGWPFPFPLRTTSSPQCASSEGHSRRARFKRSKTPKHGKETSQSNEPQAPPPIQASVRPSKNYQPPPSKCSAKSYNTWPAVLQRGGRWRRSTGAVTYHVGSVKYRNYLRQIKSFSCKPSTTVSKNVSRNGRHHVLSRWAVFLKLSPNHRGVKPNRSKGRAGPARGFPGNGDSKSSHRLRSGVPTDHTDGYRSNRDTSTNRGRVPQGYAPRLARKEEHSSGVERRQGSCSLTTSRVSPSASTGQERAERHPAAYQATPVAAEEHAVHRRRRHHSGAETARDARPQGHVWSRTSRRCSLLHPRSRRKWGDLRCGPLWNQNVLTPKTGPKKAPAAKSNKPEPKKANIGHSTNVKSGTPSEPPVLVKDFPPLTPVQAHELEAKQVGSSEPVQEAEAEDGDDGSSVISRLTNVSR